MRNQRPADWDVVAWGVTTIAVRASAGQTIS